MKYLIGIDGGGTKTNCVVTDYDLNVIFRTTGGATNFLVHSVETAVNNIFLLLKTCKENLGFEYNEIEAVLLGTAGAGRKSDAETLYNAVINSFKLHRVILKNFFIESDARITLEGAFSGKPGIIIISGTGSILFGKDDQNNFFRVGGFGRILGDEGSGFSIGKKGLQAVAKEFDGRGEKTILTKLVADNFKIDSQEKLISEIYSNSFDISKIAPLVLNSAASNDEISKEILEIESDLLLDHLIAANKSLNKDDYKISFMGGIISNDNYFSNLLIEKIKTKFPSVEIVLPENPPEIGAVILAKKYLENNSENKT